MVMLFWWILSLFGVCSFGWLPVFIDLVITAMYCCSSKDTGMVGGAYCALGGAIFAFCKCFLSLSLSNWFIAISPIWLLLATFIPGGYTITNWILSKKGLMEMPIWVWIVAIVADLVLIGTMVFSVVSEKRS